MVFKHDRRWPMQTAINDESEGPIGFIAVGSSDLFQSRRLSRKCIKNFLELYNAVQQATRWEEEQPSAGNGPADVVQWSPSAEVQGPLHSSHPGLRSAAVLHVKEQELLSS